MLKQTLHEHFRNDNIYRNEINVRYHYISLSVYAYWFWPIFWPMLKVKLQLLQSKGIGIFVKYCDKSFGGTAKGIPVEGTFVLLVTDIGRWMLKSTDVCRLGSSRKLSGHNRNVGA